MDPENTTTDTTAPVATTTDQPASPPAEQRTAPAAPTFTQEDVNRIVTKRLEEDRARRSAAAPVQAPRPAPQPNSKPPAEPDLRAELDEMRRQQTELMQRLDYTSRTARLGLDDARASALFKVYQANPDGFDDVVSALGIKAPTPAAPAAPTATQPDAPRPAPAAAPSAPTAANLPTQNGVVDIFAIPGPQLRALGPEFVRTELEKLWRIGEQQQGKPQRPRIPSQRK